MGKFISDEEMSALEAQAPKSKKFISDEEMAGLESQTKPKQEPAPLVSEDEKPWAVTSFLQGLGRGVPGGSWIDEAEGAIGTGVGKIAGHDIPQEFGQQGSLERYDRSKATNPNATRFGKLLGRGAGFVIGSQLGPLGALAESALHGAGEAEPGNRLEGAALNSASTGAGMLIGGAVSKGAINPILRYASGRVIPQPLVDFVSKTFSKAPPEAPGGALDFSKVMPKPQSIFPSASNIGGVAGNSAADYLKQYYSSKKFRQSQ